MVRTQSSSWKKSNLRFMTVGADDRLLPLHASPRSKPMTFKRLWTPENVLLFLGLLVGVCFCIFIPYGAGFDEETHMVRIMDISGFNLVPNHSEQDKTISFRDFFDLSYQRRYFNSPAFDLFAPENFQKKLDFNDRLPIQTRSVYPPVIFFPQAALAKLFWSVLNMPILPAVILMRVAGMLLYLLASYITLRLLPFGKWVFALLALSPMALFQAATLNADGFTNTFCFLLIGLVLYLFAKPASEPISMRQTALLAGIALLIGLAKPGYFVLLPLLLLLPRRRFSSKAGIFLLIAAAALAIAFTFGWTALTVPKSHFSDDGSQSLSRQLDVILAQPLAFIWNYFRSAFASLEAYFRDWVGVYGYWVGEVPEPVYWFYPLALVTALLAEPRSDRLSWKNRLFLFILFLFSTGAILFLYYYLHYSPDDITVLGRQGRYFIPTAPLFFLALAAWASVRPRIRAFASIASVALFVISLGFYCLGLYATYYTECGYGTFAGRPCTLPVYKNLDKDNAPVVPVNQTSVVSQTFISHCGPVEEVQILVNSAPVGSGSLIYSLFNQQNQVLATKKIPLSEIPIGDYFALKVTPPADQGTAAYQIRLEAPEVSSQEKIGIATRDRHLYPDGRLSVAGSNVDADLIFHYVCPNPQK